MPTGSFIVKAASTVIVSKVGFFSLLYAYAIGIFENTLNHKVRMFHACYL